MPGTSENFSRDVNKWIVRNLQAVSLTKLCPGGRDWAWPWLIKNRKTGRHGSYSYGLYCRLKTGKLLFQACKSLYERSDTAGHHPLSGLFF